MVSQLAARVLPHDQQDIHAYIGRGGDGRGGGHEELEGSVCWLCLSGRRFLNVVSGATMQEQLQHHDDAVSRHDTWQTGEICSQKNIPSARC